MWKDEWNQCKVSNYDLVSDPSVRLCGYDLPRASWSVLNRFRSGHGPCRDMKFKWGVLNNNLCDCGVAQSMSHIVNECPNTKFSGGLSSLHVLHDGAREWLSGIALTAFDE